MTPAQIDALRQRFAGHTNVLKLIDHFEEKDPRILESLGYMTEEGLLKSTGLRFTDIDNFSKDVMEKIKR